MEPYEETIAFERTEYAVNVFGNFDENIQWIEESFQVKVFVRGEEIKIVGNKPDVEKARIVTNKLIALAESGETITKQVVNYLTGLALDDQLEQLQGYQSDCICTTSRGKQIKVKTNGQKQYIDAINKNGIVFGIGPAGTGKTFLAVAMAVNAFRNKKVNRIVITRPAVEAGEKLGFLPGDLQNKVDPYLRPLYDALYEIMGGDTYQKYIERGMIEVAPLAYMRGRTLDDSFIILDEAQNTTAEQMKMFLTRIGFGSQVVVTGDITQIDLPKDKKSGLKEAVKILHDIPGIDFVYLTQRDVVRHRLVQKIIEAYEAYETPEE